MSARWAWLFALACTTLVAASLVACARVPTLAAKRTAVARSNALRTATLPAATVPSPTAAATQASLATLAQTATLTPSAAPSKAPAPASALLRDVGWLGHASFRLTGEKVIYIDPYQLKTSKPADIILITHSHGDHCSPADVAKIKKPETTIVTVADCANKFQGDVKVVKVGDKLDVSLFKPGDKITVTGISKGRGFAGGVKRYHFHGGPKTHGQSDRQRAPGAIGSTTRPGRVYKGTRMAGRLGDDRVTVQRLEVIRTDPAKNLLLVKGAVPGAANTLLIIKKSVERK